MEEITSNPNVVLSEEEYATLTPQQRQLGWVQIQVGNQLAGFENRYRRQTPQDRQSALERTVEWRIQNNPNVILSEQEYGQLTPQQKELGWVETTEGSQHDGYKTMYRRRTQSDINNEHDRNIKTQMSNILSRGNTYHIENYSSPLPELAIRNDRDTYVQLSQDLYNEYKRFEAQLRN